MIVIFTDFGTTGPYVGQMRMVLAARAPGVPVINLMHDAPAFAPELAGCLLAALAPELPAAAILLAVVDPGVGSERAPLLVSAGAHRLIGPDNGLLVRAARRLAREAGTTPSFEEILWRPARLSHSFHGRDLFAPVAASLALGEPVETRPLEREPVGCNLPDDLDAVVYVDCYGNATTGRRIETVPADATLLVGGRPVPRGATFCAVPEGAPFWHDNSNGLVEIAVNRGHAAELLNLAPGSPVRWT